MTALFNRLRPEAFTGRMLLALSGPLLWALHFGFLYGVQTVSCSAFGQRHDLWIDLAVIIITVAALLALLLLIGKPHDSEPENGENPSFAAARLFLLEVMSGLGVLSFSGIAWTSLCLFVLPACLSLA